MDQSILVSTRLYGGKQELPKLTLLDTSPTLPQYLYSSFSCFVRFLQTDVILPVPQQPGVAFISC